MRLKVHTMVLCVNNRWCEEDRQIGCRQVVLLHHQLLSAFDWRRRGGGKGQYRRNHRWHWELSHTRSTPFSSSGTYLEWAPIAFQGRRTCHRSRWIDTTFSFWLPLRAYSTRAVQPICAVQHSNCTVEHAKLCSQKFARWLQRTNRDDIS